MYWEYNGQTAVRMKNWKAYQKGKGSWELYDLAKDVEEKQNVAAANPKILEQLVAHAKTSHTPVRPGEIYNWALVAQGPQPYPTQAKAPKETKVAPPPADATDSSIRSQAIVFLFVAVNSTEPFNGSIDFTPQNPVLYENLFCSCNPIRSFLQTVCSS